MVTHYRLASPAPLCPAGHLPHKGGDQLGARSSDYIRRFAKHEFFPEAKAKPLVISPLVEEMSGRTEGENSTHQGSSLASVAGNHSRKSAQ